MVAWCHDVMRLTKYEIHISMNRMENTNIDDIVTVMERGQVTIPVKLRQALDIHKGMKLIVRMTGKNSLVLAPIQISKQKKLQEVIKKMIREKKVYWTAEDDRNLQKVRKLSRERAKKLKAIW